MNAMQLLSAVIMPSREAITSITRVEGVVLGLLAGGGGQLALAGGWEGAGGEGGDG